MFFFNFIFLTRQYMVHKSKYYKKVYSEKKCSHPCPHSPLPQVIAFISFWCFLPGFLYAKICVLFPSFSYTKSVLCTFLDLAFLLTVYDFLNMHVIIVYNSVL